MSQASSGFTCELGLLLTFPLSIVAAALLAAVVAAPVLKLDDHYFALATLAVTLLVELIGTQWAVGDGR